jgi:hypothetical protein
MNRDVTSIILFFHFLAVISKPVDILVWNFVKMTLQHLAKGSKTKSWKFKQFYALNDSIKI